MEEIIWCQEQTEKSWEEGNWDQDYWERVVFGEEAWIDWGRWWGRRRWWGWGWIIGRWWGGEEIEDAGTRWCIDEWTLQHWMILGMIVDNVDMIWYNAVSISE